MRVQLLLQPEPHVVYRNVTIPIPTQVGPPDNSVRITQNAQIDVCTYRNDRYLVEICIPSWSGDTRMVLGALGVGTAGGAASRVAQRHGFPFAQRAIREALGVTLRLSGAAIRWAVTRPIAIIGGMIQSNQTATVLQFSRNLDDGTQVDYVVIYVPNSLRAGSQRR